MRLGCCFAAFCVPANVCFGNWYSLVFRVCHSSIQPSTHPSSHQSIHPYIPFEFRGKFVSSSLRKRDSFEAFIRLNFWGNGFILFSCFLFSGHDWGLWPAFYFHSVVVFYFLHYAIHQLWPRTKIANSKRHRNHKKLVQTYCCCMLNSCATGDANVGFSCILAFWALLPSEKFGKSGLSWRQRHGTENGSHGNEPYNDSFCMDN